MAERIHQERRGLGVPLETLVLSRQEATNLAALLIGQLAGVPVVGNQAGAAPMVRIDDSGRIECEVTFILKPDQSVV